MCLGRGPMLRRATITILMLAVAVSSSAFAQSRDDWKYYGTQDAGSTPKEAVDWFYLANQIHHQPDGTFLVWTEALNLKALFGRADKATVKRVGLAMKRGYVPPYVIANTGIVDTPPKKRSAAQLLATVIMAEELADEAFLTAKLRLLMQMDCANQRYQLMSAMGTMHGKSFSSSTPNGWEYIPPDSTVSELAGLICPPKSGG